MKNKLFSVLFAAVLLLPTSVFAGSILEDYLRGGGKEDVPALAGELSKSIDESFVGIGIVLDVSKATLNGKELVAVEVLRTLPGGPAEKAGLKRGDLILEVNGKQFTSRDEFKNEILGDGKSGRTVRLKLLSTAAIEMKTVFFGISDDKRAAAEALKKGILAESIALGAKYDNLAAELLQKLKNPGSELSPEDEQRYFDLLDKLDNWFQNKMEQIENLKTPQ